MNNEGATDEDQNTITESAALAEIVAWSQDCPSWQRDALRRLCTADALEADDFEQLLAMCKGTQSAFVPLGAEHVPDPEAGEAVVTLRALSGIKNVNLLKEGERFTFDKTGVTAIYGDNGSGKSGYARVLKKLCRARSPRNDVIVPSIYARSSGPAEATAEFAVGGQNRTASWVDGRAPDAMLSAVSVFDSRTANVHVDSTNDVAYTPLPLKMLAGLAAACQELKNRLKAEIDAIRKQTPAVISNPECGSDTAVGKFLKQLNGGTTTEAVETLATLSDQEKAQLARLNTELAGDPARTARHLRQCKNRLDELVFRIEVLRGAASDARWIALHDLRDEAVAAKNAALLASTTLFSGEPLKGIGTETWAALWEAARTYSAAEAYPGRTFPVLSDDARCVLCQQELDGEARSRLGRFEDFVRDDSSRRADAADNAYSDALKEARAASIAQARLRPVVALIDEELGEPDLAARTRETLVDLLCRLRWIVRHHDAIDSTPLPDLAEPPVAELRSLSARLEARAATLQSDRQTPAMKALVSERDELAAKEWLHGIKADVLAQIARLNDIAALQTAEALTTTNRITSKSTELAKSLVTNMLRARFTKELDRLGIAGLAIELSRQSTKQGVPLFQVKMIGSSAAKVGDVLSEGEHRCVALAAFLAEQATIDARSAIVFDDPVSSLDHLHREKVAERLADEGLDRQIVVFTHDIAFLFLLTEACRERGTHLAMRSINRGRDAAGIVRPNPPLRAQPTSPVNRHGILPPDRRRTLTPVWARSGTRPGGAVRVAEPGRVLLR